MATKDAPKKDGSGGGKQTNAGRGGCSKPAGGGKGSNKK